MQSREAASSTDFSVITMDEDVESNLKEASIISMGTEISAEDMANIVELCEQVGGLPCCTFQHATERAANHMPCAEPGSLPLMAVRL